MEDGKWDWFKAALMPVIFVIVYGVVMVLLGGEPNLQTGLAWFIALSVTEISIRVNRIHSKL